MAADERLALHDTSLAHGTADRAPYQLDAHTVPPSDPSTSLGVSEIAFESFVHEIAFESFGVRIGVRADDARVWARLAELIPPHSRRCDADAIEHRFSVTSDDGAKFTVRYDIRDGVPARLIDAASWVATDVDLPLALGLLEDHLVAASRFALPTGSSFTLAPSDTWIG